MRHPLVVTLLLPAALFLSAVSVDLSRLSGPLVTNFSSYDMSGKYKYIGCFDRGEDWTNLPHIVLIANMSSARCYMHCMDRGNLFFGVSSDTCACGDSYDTARRKSEAACNISCDLEPGEKCGGRDEAMSVYVIIEKFYPIGCFLDWYKNSSDFRHLGDKFTKLGCALACQQKTDDQLPPFFGMRDGHLCECIYKIHRFNQREDNNCLSVCLEPHITGCGQGGLTSVYEMQYASSVSRMLGSYISFMSTNRQIRLTINSIDLPSVLMPQDSRLLFKVYSEDAPESGRFTELIGQTRDAPFSRCPEGWLGYSMQSSGHRVGHRCYLKVDSPALSWTAAMQHCWQLNSDLFYKEDETELQHLANTSSGREQLWVGLHMRTGEGIFVWTEDTTGVNGNATRQLPSLADNGCVLLNVRSELLTRHSCGRRAGFICKRFGSLHSYLDYEFSTLVKSGRQLRLQLHQSANLSADPQPVLQFNLSLQQGATSHSVPIPSCQGCILTYKTIERIPMKICHPGPEGSAFTSFNRCQQPGNAPSQTQFGKFTCPTENFLRLGIGSWQQPLGDWSEEVWYFVTEVHVNNRFNLTIRVQSNQGVACTLASSYPPTWLKFICNIQMKGLTVFASNQKYPYMHMCDLQVFGSLVRDLTPPRPTTSSFGPSDRILDLKLRGIFRRESSGSYTQVEQPPAEDLYLRVYNDGNLVSTVNPWSSDYFSIPLKYQQSLDKLILFSTVRDHRTGDPRPLKSCTTSLTIGDVRCRFIDRNYLSFSIRERINLHSCSQSSRLLPVDYCDNAFDFFHGDTHQFGRCAQTTSSFQPWWKARVHSTFVFETLVLYSRQGNRQWTRHFSVTIEQTVCVNVVNGSVFDKKAFNCGLPGSEITVTALADRVSLSLCEVVAYGRPGGCGEVTPKVPGDRCNARLRSHVNYGSAPYEKGMRCQWQVGGSSVHTLLLTFPEFRTASEKDYVEVYEGRGTSGKLLKRFYGNGDHRPKHPWVTAHGLSNYIIAQESYLTIIFVTNRSAAADEFRSLETHRGFTAEMHMVMLHKPSYLMGTEGTVCSTDLYLSYRTSFCQFRNGLHPIFEYGMEHGMSAINEIERLLRLQQNRPPNDTNDSPWSQRFDPRPQSPGPAVLRRKREPSQNLMRQHFCYSPERIRSLEPWRRRCCCSRCNRLHFIMQCRHAYESVPSRSCDLRSERLPFHIAD